MKDDETQAKQERLAGVGLLRELALNADPSRPLFHAYILVKFLLGVTI